MVEQDWTKITERGGKHGRVIFNEGQEDDRNGERYLWSFPVCMKQPSHANCDNDITELTDLSGTIAVQNYASKTSKLWKINVPSTHKIIFQFDTAQPFSLEYHNKCVFDKVHIFSGDMDGDFQRRARFCGPNPKKNGKPHDGSKRIIEVNGNMDFWDSPHDTFSHQAFVGFDSDQSNNGAGFVLKYWTERVYEYDFADVRQSHQFITSRVTELFRDIKFQRDTYLDSITNRPVVDKDGMRNKKRNTNLLNNRFITRTLWALARNKDNPDFDKKRACATGWNTSVSANLQAKFKDFEDNFLTENFDNGIGLMKDLLLEYMGNCQKASQNWPVRLTDWIDEVNNARLN